MTVREVYPRSAEEARSVIYYFLLPYHHNVVQVATVSLIPACLLPVLYKSMVFVCVEQIPVLNWAGSDGNFYLIIWL